MMGRFFQNKLAEARSEGSKSKKTLFFVAGEIAEKLRDLTKLVLRKKAIEDQIEPHKKSLKEEGLRAWISSFCKHGVPPQRPYALLPVDEKGEPTGDPSTFQIQDRGGQYGIEEKQRAALLDALMAAQTEEEHDKAEEILNAETYEEIKITFDRGLMQNDKVADLVEMAMEALAAKAVKDGILTPEEVLILIQVKSQTSFRPGILDRVGDICEGDPERMRRFIKAMGSSCCYFVEA